MPAMRKTKYKADNGEIHPIRMREATYTAVLGTIPDGETTNSNYVFVTKSKRRYGIGARHVVIGRTVGTAPDTYVKYSRLPVCDPTDWNAETGAWQVGNVVSYEGTNWEIVSRVNENER